MKRFSFSSAKHISVVNICGKTELLLKQLMFINDNNLPDENLTVSSYYTYLMYLINFMKIWNVYFLDITVIVSFILLKLITFCYLKIRLHNLSKPYLVKKSKDKTTEKHIPS